jgi:hypothetical protein
MKSKYKEMPEGFHLELENVKNNGYKIIKRCYGCVYYNQKYNFCDYEDKFLDIYDTANELLCDNAIQKFELEYESTWGK